MTDDQKSNPDEHLDGVGGTQPDATSADSGQQDQTSSPAAEPPRRRPWWVLIAVVGALVIGLAAWLFTGGRAPWTAQPSPAWTPTQSSPTVEPSAPRSNKPHGLERARELLGQPRSGGTWLSGIWAGGDTATGGRVERFGQWRGSAVDAITMYPATNTWETIAGSNWHIETFADSPAILSYGLPLLPVTSGDTLADIAAGKQDQVFRQIAALLVANGRGNTIIRIGWEANGAWFPWNTTVDTAEDYKAAFRRVVGVMKEQGPDLVFDFDIGCGVKLRGQQDRLDALNRLYPGDDVVDLIGCDTYDWHQTVTVDEATWALTQRPKEAPGIADVADFARARGKGLTFPEWGLASPAEGGQGDNPYFITKMRGFFEANADILVMESYFSEPTTTLANSIWEPDQNPQSSQVYARLW